MAEGLSVSVGGHSIAGRKPANQDRHAAAVPGEPQLTYKGIAAAVADGISSSNVSHVASETAVESFLREYYCTSEAWSVRKSGYQVLAATNSWLHSLTRQSDFRYDQDRGYVCTFAAVVLKSATAHVFHVGDARVYRLRGGRLDQLTEDHRLRVSRDTSHLTRAMGFRPELELDYTSAAAEAGDVFLLLTDGVHQFVDGESLTRLASEHLADADSAAEAIVRAAHDGGSDDNLTAVVLRVDRLPRCDAGELLQKLTELPAPPPLAAGETLDGYRVVRELHASSRSRVYLVEDAESGRPLAMKTPAADTAADAEQLDRFLTEEWIGRRIDHPHVLKTLSPARTRTRLYCLSEYVEGRTLRRWMAERPRADLEAVRGMVEQIARGLQAFHRGEMLHQDLRPDNVLVGDDGVLRIIDFGSTRVAGVAEIATPLRRNDVLGTLQYMAPEYLLGEAGTQRSDIYSLGVIAYQMLTGRLPYGAQLARARTRSAQRQAKYVSALEGDLEVPVWVDGALRRAVEVDPLKRYGELSEFLYDLNHPRAEFVSGAARPLIERDPAAFFKRLSLALAVLLLISVIMHLL